MQLLHSRDASSNGVTYDIELLMVYGNPIFDSPVKEVIWFEQKRWQQVHPVMPQLSGRDGTLLFLDLTSYDTDTGTWEDPFMVVSLHPIV